MRTANSHHTTLPGSLPPFVRECGNEQESSAVLRLGARVREPDLARAAVVHFDAYDSVGVEEEVEPEAAAGRYVVGPALIEWTGGSGRN
ncbi:hypothetical protein GCM10023080_007030 [Streptomyces pseudoechinosporeus]